MINTIKRIVGLLLCLMLILGVFTGCNDGGNGADTETENDPLIGSQSSEQSDVKNQEAIKLSSLMINGIDISEYSIVYATSFLREQCYEDYGTFGEKLAQQIEDITGVRLAVVPDTDKSVQYEILLGVVARAECIRYYNADTLLEDDDYCAMYSNGKILLGATCLAGVVDATEKLMEYINTQAKSNGDKVNIPDTFDVSGENHVTRIVCVGDSITQGVGASNEVNFSYPARLQKELGYEYDVVNYGFAGATMCSYALDTYAKQSYIAKSGYYDDVIDVAHRADIVIIMLGTNDGAGTAANTELLKNDFDSFAADYKINLTKMMKDLRKANGDIKIVLFNSPVCHRPTWEANYVTYLRPYQKQVAQELGIDYYDISTYTAVNTTATEWPDQLHPNDDGYKTLARGAERALKTLYNLK